MVEAGKCQGMAVLEILKAQVSMFSQDSIFKYSMPELEQVIEPCLLGY
jgi:hypothetical protein